MTMLVVALRHASPRTKKSVADEKGLVLKMLKIMEHGHTVLKAKAVLCLALLFELHPPWLMTACNHKFVSLVDKLSKEKDDYLRSSLAEMVSTTRGLLPKLIASMEAEVEKIQSRKYSKPGSASGSRAALGLQGALGCFPAMLHLLTSAVMRSSVVSERMLQMVSLFLVKVELLSFPGQRELWQCVLNVLEALSQQYDTLSLYSDEMVGRILPAVCQLMTSGKSGDTRFLCARLFCDMVLFYLSSAAPERPQGRPSRPYIGTEFLRERVLAFLPKLLSDEDPIPLYALKLGKAALDQDSGLMEDVVRMGLVPEFFSYLSLEHSNNNVHNMWICKAAIASPLVPLELLVEGGAGARSVAILKYAYDNNVETFLEPALDLCTALLEREKSEPEGEGLDLGDLKNAAHIIHMLQSDEDASVGTAASVCVSLLMDCFDGLVPGATAA
jgi:serine/threonine-protein kinase ULK4